MPRCNGVERIICMNNVETVQVQVLKECIRGRIPVTVYLMNGFQIRGLVTAFDSNVVIVQTDEKQQMIYKHAFSTIVPVKQVKIKTEA